MSFQTPTLSRKRTLAGDSSQTRFEKGASSEVAGDAVLLPRSSTIVFLSRNAGWSARTQAKAPPTIPPPNTRTSQNEDGWVVEEEVEEEKAGVVEYDEVFV